MTTFPLQNVSLWWVLLLGISFGFWLEVSGLGSPRKLNAQLTLRDWTVFKVMFTTIVVAATAIYGLQFYEYLDVELLKIPTVFYWAMGIGGLFVGCGLAIGGYCPGTSIVGLFSGRLDALAFIGGVFGGVYLFAACSKLLEPLYDVPENHIRQTLMEVTGLPVSLIILILIGIAVTGYFVGTWFETQHHGVIHAEDLDK